MAAASRSSCWPDGAGVQPPTRLKSLQMNAPPAGRALLTPRQQEILRLVVEEFVATGQPVGSKTLVETAALTAAASTVPKPTCRS